MESKLEAYRSKKRREAMMEGAKNSLKGALAWTERAIDVRPTEVNIATFFFIHKTSTTKIKKN